MAWYAPTFDMGCNIHVPIIPGTPPNIHSDIYAMDYWLSRHIHDAGLHVNLSGATHVFIPSSMKKKAQLIRMHQDKMFIVNDFGPFCRFQRLGHYKNVRFLMMSPGDGGCRTNKVDIIAPHTVAWNDDPTEVKRKYRIFFRGHLPKPELYIHISMHFQSFVYLHYHLCTLFFSDCDESGINVYHYVHECIIPSIHVQSDASS